MGSSAVDIGLTYSHGGDLDQAEAQYQVAQEQFEAAADLAGQADVLVNRASLEWLRGRREFARQYLQSAEALLANVDVKGGQVNPHKLANIRTFEANIYVEFGDSEKAKTLYAEALAIYSEHPQPLAEAKTQVDHGVLLLRLGDNEQARNWFERAREILEAFSGEGPHDSLGTLYLDLGRAYQDLGDSTTALKYYRLAEGAFTALDEPLELAMARENIGVIAGQQGNTTAAIEAIEQSLAVYRQYQNADHEVQALYNLYALYSVAGDPTALQMIRQILSLLETHNIDQEIEAGVLLGILPYEIKSTDPALLITYRERLRQLKTFYEQHEEPINLGRVLLRLADTEQHSGNTASMVQYAREAEAYVDSIPLPLRISCLMDLGFYLWNDNPQASFDYFMEGFDLAEGLGYEGQQLGFGQTIQLLVQQHAADLDRERSLAKAQQIVDTSQLPVVRALFQSIVALLQGPQP